MLNIILTFVMLITDVQFKNLSPKTNESVQSCTGYKPFVVGDNYFMKIKCICNYCHCIYYSKEWIANTTNPRYITKYCSKKCKTIFSNKNRPKRNYIKKCLNCKKEFKIYVSQVNKKFCSKKCYTKKGELNPKWMGGITSEGMKIRNSNEYKQWRINIFKRDNYTCQLCNQIGGVLHADHIKQFAFYPELRLDINNGRTLCFNCHKKTDTYLRGRQKNT